MKVHTSINNIVTLVIAATLLTSWTAVAQSAPSTGKPNTPRTWQDLGFDSAPEGFRTDEIALIDGLNTGRGGWSFNGSVSEGDTTSPLEGRMQIVGSFENGMVPMWKLNLGWPAEEPQHVVVYTILASPEATGFEPMLFRLGPMKPGAGVKARPAAFRGTWDLERRTITWKEMDPRAMVRGRISPEEQPVETHETPEAMESFEMVIAANGEITIRKPEHAVQRQGITGRSVARVGKPYVEKLVSKKSSYDTYADVTDSRAKRCLPMGARDITLQMERGGHFARYKVSETDFHNFLNTLWEANKDSSAHQRDEMHGEGEPVNQDQVAKRFERVGWEPLKNAIQYYSPSKGSGAMTTYFYDRDPGIAYHDTGYW